MFLTGQKHVTFLRSIQLPFLTGLRLHSTIVVGKWNVKFLLTAAVCIFVYMYLQYMYVVHVLMVLAQYAGTLRHHDLAQQQFSTHAQIPRIRWRSLSSQRYRSNQHAWCWCLLHVAHTCMGSMAVESWESVQGNLNVPLFVQKVYRVLG